jgi:3'(2'), 5'-bisphosphate nucleotidase
MVTVTAESLRRLEQIARAAGAAIMRFYAEHVDVQYKADHSPLTAADRAAHRLIVDALQEWDSSVPVVSEEGEIPGYEVRRCWPRFWLVDPLDGTKEFLQRNGEFTVNIALIEDGAPILAVVYAPALDLLYSAGTGLGAWKVAAAAAPERIHSRVWMSGTPAVVAESRSHPSAELEDYLRKLPVVQRVQAGSSLKFCWVAEGKADLYPRFGRTMEWDSAAGDCIYRNSGQDGQRTSPLRYNTPKLENPHFVIGE